MLASNIFIIKEEDSKDYFPLCEIRSENNKKKLLSFKKQNKTKAISVLFIETFMCAVKTEILSHSGRN